MKYIKIFENIDFKEDWEEEDEYFAFTEENGWTKFTIVENPGITVISNVDMGGIFRYHKDECRQYEYKNIKCSVKKVYYKTNHKKDYFFPFGFLIFKNNKPHFMFSLYEVHGSDIDQKKGVITLTGYETIINYWIEDDHYKEVYTN